MNKNILIIISSLGGGGAEKVATTIGSYLSKKNNIFYLTRYENKKEYTFLGKKMCMNERFSESYLIGIYRIIKRSFIIKRICKKHKINVSISFMEESNFPNILSKYILGNKSKIIVSIRNSIDSMSIFYRTFIKTFYNKADLIIPNSNEEKVNLIDNYGIKQEKITHIYNPLDLKKIEKLSNEDIEENIFKSDIFNFITVGRIVNQKNQKFMINCFNKFSLEHPKSQLIIIGDGPLKKELMELSNNGNIIFLGHQKNVYRYLSKSDCFIFSSLHEGFPNAVLEAMACGLPIISTMFKTGIKEIIEDNKYGIIIKKPNEREFVNTMKYIYNNKEKLNYYRKQSLIRCRNFNVDKIVKEREDIL